ncbi:MAG: hypothetical protein JWN95_1377 [Frankiales bacterium]|nr:hypothetical protein [Frankiales bacterium]
MNSAQAAIATCAGFQKFHNDMLMNTPHSPTLLAEVEAMSHDAVLAGSGDPTKYGHLLDDATKLVGYVGSSDWMVNGNIQSASVVAMQTDCP